MIKVVLIGAGNVAFHIAKAFEQSSKIDLIQRYSKSTKNDSFFDINIPKTSHLNQLLPADIYIIAINDAAIASVSNQLTFTNGLVVHTSGSKPLKTLQCMANKGVFYPLQTFSIDKKMIYKHIPICIEAENDKDLELLQYLANAISEKVYKIDSQQREKLHIAAVFANNFTNYMFKIANDICIENNFSFEVLKPLIFETVKKLEKLSPYDAQTGPARRQDLEVIKNQLQQLDGDTKEIYNLVSKSILKTYQV